MSADTPHFGVSFSPTHAAWLGLDPAETLRSLIRDVGLRYIRLSAYWNELAPEADHFDVGPLQRWLDLADKWDARVLLTAGLRAQRHPEFFPPAWLLTDPPLPRGTLLDQQPRIVARILLMLERLIATVADYPVIDAWQVENEPFLPAAHRTLGWRFSPALLAREIEVVAAADPRRRPIVVNHSSTTILDRHWRTALDLGDVLAQNLYPRVPVRALQGRYWNRYAMGPLSPRLSAQAQLARRLGKDFWITELQAEPWEKLDHRSVDPRRSGSISPARLRANIVRARATGASRIYLWGGEWWHYAAGHHGDHRYLEAVTRLVNPS